MKFCRVLEYFGGEKINYLVCLIRIPVLTLGYCLDLLYLLIFLERGREDLEFEENAGNWRPMSQSLSHQILFKGS